LSPPFGELTLLTVSTARLRRVINHYLNLKALLCVVVASCIIAVKEDLALMAAQPDINDRRINVFVSPEAKRMLRELGEAWYPNLRRPDGTVIEQLIRMAYARLHPVTSEPYDPRAREQQMYWNPTATPLPDHGAPQSGMSRSQENANLRLPRIPHRGADPPRISDEFENVLDQEDEKRASQDALDDDD
jgi:hypothetical protein